MIISPDHIGDAHGDVVHDDRQVIGRASIGTPQNKIIQFFVLKRDRPFDHIMKHGFAALRGLQPHHGIRAWPESPVPTLPIVLRLEPEGFGRLPSCLQLLGGTVAVISLSCGDKALDHLQINRISPGLKVRALVPVYAEPFEGLHDRPGRFVCGPFLVGIFDSKNEFPFLPSGEQPVKESGSCSADV